MTPIDGKTLLILNSTGMTFSELASKFHLTRGQVSGLIYKQKVKDKNRKYFETLKLGTPLQLRGDAIIIGDIHVPTTDYDFSKLVTIVAAKHGIKRLVIGGDVFNMDSFSTYDAIVKQPTWIQERDAARILFKEWSDWFDEIYVIMGNHDRRLQKWSDGQLDEQDIFGMVTTSDKVRI